MAAPKTLDDAVAEAKKVVGDKASMPKPKVDAGEMLDAVGPEFSKFQSALTKLYTAAVLIERMLKNYQYAMKQNAAIYEKEDFGPGR